MAATLKLETQSEFNGQGPRRTGLALVLQTMKRQAEGVLQMATGARRRRPLPGAALATASLVNVFLGAISVEQVRGSRLVNVSVTSSDPAFAARAADTLVEEYVQFNLELRTEATRKSLDFLDEEIAKQQTEGRRQRARDGASIASTTTRCRSRIARTRSVARLNQVNDEYTRAQDRAHSEGNALQPGGMAVASTALAGLHSGAHAEPAGAVASRSGSAS